MNTYNKNETNRILNSKIIIHWWNFTRKVLDFNGTVSDYLKREAIKYTVKTKLDNDFEMIYFTFSFNCGSMNKIKYTVSNFEDGVRMAINIRLTYLGDKSKFNLLGRNRSINF